MIKPFTIQHIRQEPDGAKTVFFHIRKITPKGQGNRTFLEMQSAIYVKADEDVDTVLLNNLTEAGWI